MKILNLEQFRALPENILFSKYEPCVFGELEIKGETWECDFLTQQIAGAIDCEDTGDFVDKLYAAQKHGASIAIDLNCMGRDGCFEDDQLFAVWEDADVAKLIARLQQCMHNPAVRGRESPSVPCTGVVQIPNKEET